MTKAGFCSSAGVVCSVVGCERQEGGVPQKLGGHVGTREGEKLLDYTGGRVDTKKGGKLAGTTRRLVSTQRKGGTRIGVLGTWRTEKTMAADRNSGNQSRSEFYEFKSQD